MTEMQISARDGGAFNAFVVMPHVTPAPAIIVIQEIFGVNHVMRDLCQLYAARGYIAICPDLFWRQEPGIQITDKTDAEWARAFELYKGFDEALGVADLQSTLDAIRRHPDCNGKVGSVGYCLGGKLAYLMATRTNADCNVSFYGVAIDAALDEMSQISKPLLMHIAEKDQFVSSEAQDQIRSAAGQNSNVEAHTYAGMDHAFARVGGAHFDKANADLANNRTDDFFSAYLK